MNNFHINSMVQGTSVTFFITTVNEEMVSLIQLASEMFELCFGSNFSTKAHVKLEFEYDFDKFLSL